MTSSSRESSGTTSPSASSEGNPFDPLREVDRLLEENDLLKKRWEKREAEIQRLEEELEREHDEYEEMRDEKHGLEEELDEYRKSISTRMRNFVTTINELQREMSDLDDDFVY